ncbi:hypothetical protein [Vibrio breoganii]|nr:hypothetical protein [Vibrio breoganii]
MKLCRALLIALCLVSFSTFSSEWEMSLPVRENDVLKSELRILTDGRIIKGVFTSSLLENFGSRFTSDFKNWLKARDPILFPETLADNGLAITLNTRDLEINLSADVSILSEQSITLDSYSSDGPYSESAFWSVQNNVNLTADYFSLDENVSSGLELNSGFNVGGYKGVNGIFRGYINNDGSETDFSRGSTFLFMDFPDKPYRASMGDVDTFSNGHLALVPVGGVRLSRDYQLLQPDRQIQNTGSQYLELTESATIDIYVNGYRATTIRLGPGRYDVDNLPLSDGQNEIRLEIQYASGETEVISYSQFYNADLLMEGLSDFGVSVGYVSSIDTQGIDYSNDLISVGFYEYGVTDTLTLGINGLYNTNGYQVGGSFVTGTLIGNVGLRLSQSGFEDALNSENEPVDWGYAASLDFSTAIWGANELGGSNFRLSLEQMNDFTTTPWAPTNLFTQYGGRLDYTYSISSALDLTYYTSHFLVTDSKSAERYEASHNIRADWRSSSWRVSVGAEYTDDYNTNKEWQGYLDINYYFNFSSSTDRLTLTYNSKLEKVRAEYYKNSENKVGSLGYKVGTSQIDDLTQADASADYNSNRWRADVFASASETQSEDIAWRTKGTLATTLVVADGHFGWGRAPIGPMVLVDVHPTLAESDIFINEDYYGQAESISSYRGNSVIDLTRSHSDNQLIYSSPNAPMGYDLGRGVELYKPGSLTTHILTVGSDASRTVIGTLLLPNGEPVSYLRGYVTGANGISHSIFTNKAGRFVIEGIKIGVYKVSIDGHYGEFKLNDESDTLTYLSPINLQ